MIKGILFDLDGTLLDINIHILLSNYLNKLGPVVAPIFDTDAHTAVNLVNGGVAAMFDEHSGITNQEAFNSYIFKKTRVELDRPEIQEVLDTFYSTEFPALRSHEKPIQHNAQVLSTCKSMGLKMGIATQPIFPMLAQQARIKWAEVDGFDFLAVSSYENSYSVKPDAGYFRMMAERIGVEPEECLMVGDEPLLDMGAQSHGFKTFYVGSKPQELESDGEGTLFDLINYLDSHA